MDVHSAVLRQEIEAKLARRIPGALSPLAQQSSRLQPVGNLQLDALLGGGLPLGAVCEVTGPEGSGRSSIALSLLAQVSREAACAYVDVSDTLSPHSAAAAGVCLEHLLWVRLAAPMLSQSPNLKPGTSTLPEAYGRPRETGQGYGCGPHPRMETKGVAPALEYMLFAREERRHRKMEGTPGYPNQPLGLTTASQGQIEWERFNPRRVDGTDPLRLLDRQAAEAARQRASLPSTAPCTRPLEQKPWNRLGRALLATDQILQSGGFRVMVLDLGSVAPEQTLRIPSATWFRFRRAAQEGNVMLLLLTQQPCARSSAACVLECSAGGPLTIRGVLAAAVHTAEVARQRTGPAFGKKAPGRIASWQATAAWMGAVGR